MAASKAAHPSRILGHLEPFDSRVRAAGLRAHGAGQRALGANGTGNILELVGDYTNPILKPQAADIVKKSLGLQSNAGPFTHFALKER